jgi:Putative RNA methylase family UPF0020
MTDATVVSAAVHRKRLGQVFTGERLARVLGALARAADAQTIVDPMAGLGDMLAACARVGARGARFAAIEIDPDIARASRTRLGELDLPAPVVTGSAFDVAAWDGLPKSWDLVITNPPYVRYQLGSTPQLGGHAIPGADDVRKGLRECIASAANLDESERNAFLACASEYSGLADLAVPSWLLCCARVTLNGRLAIVVPNTWLSRDYATPVLYVLRRFFDIEFVVEDQDRTWFTEALVRTMLVVARRVKDKGTPYAPGGHLRLSLTGDLANDASIVGRAFPGSITPEIDLADWARRCLAERRGDMLSGIQARWSDEQDLIVAIQRGIRRHPALPSSDHGRLPLVAAPELIRLHVSEQSDRLVGVEDLGWSVGQGLRTGANSFFYVTEDRQHGGYRSSLLPDDVLDLPPEVLIPAVRRQSELPPDRRQVLENPTSRVILLEGWALPEDIGAVNDPEHWRPIDADLAKLVRAGEAATLERAGRAFRLPELSAVRTNVRAAAQDGSRGAAFWYQLPPLAPRHRPAILVARVNGRAPIAYRNSGLIVDANFSTLWPRSRTAVDARAMLALLSSTWVAAFLELIGTVMGGGALKIEATHFRQLLVPAPDDVASRELTRLGQALSDGDDIKATIAAIDDITLGLLGARPAAGAIRDLAQRRLDARLGGSPTLGEPFARSATDR